MTNQTPEPTRRSLLKFAGVMPLALTLGGGLSACAPQPNHGLDDPHIAYGEGDDIWQAIEQVATTYRAHRTDIPVRLAAAHQQDIVLTGFLRKTPTFNRLLLTRRAVGCPVCNAQKLWPAVEVHLADATENLRNGPVKIYGIMDATGAKGAMPFAIKRACIVQT